MATGHAVTSEIELPNEALTTPCQIASAPSKVTVAMPPDHSPRTPPRMMVGLRTLRPWAPNIINTSF